MIANTQLMALRSGINYFQIASLFSCLSKSLINIVISKDD